MVCNIEYEEMMSLRLDGMLSPVEEASLDTHVAVCPECAPLWNALREADQLIRTSMRQPLPVPEGFHMRVMAQVAAAPVRQPVLVPASPVSVLPIPLDQATDWRQALAGYLQAVGAVALALLGTLGLLLALLMSGTLTMGEPVASMLEPVRTLINAMVSWARSIVFGIGPGTLTVSGLILGALLLVGWQVVAGYHRNVFDQASGGAYLEAAA